MAAKKVVVVFRQMPQSSAPEAGPSQKVISLIKEVPAEHLADTIQFALQTRNDHRDLFVGRLKDFEQAEWSMEIHELVFDPETQQAPVAQSAQDKESFWEHLKFWK